MRSVVVVLPASMWAMIPMLRVFSSGKSRAMFSYVPSGGVPSGGWDARTELDRAQGPVGGAGRTRYGVGSCLAPGRRLLCHCSNHHRQLTLGHPAVAGLNACFLIGPQPALTSGNARKPCLIPP